MLQSTCSLPGRAPAVTGTRTCCPELRAWGRAVATGDGCVGAWSAARSLQMVAGGQPCPLRLAWAQAGLRESTPRANALRKAEVLQNIHPDFGWPATPAEENTVVPGGAKKLPVLSTEGQTPRWQSPRCPPPAIPPGVLPSRCPASWMRSLCPQEALLARGRMARVQRTCWPGHHLTSNPAPCHRRGKQAPRSVPNPRDAYQQLAVPCVARTPLGEPPAQPETHNPTPIGDLPHHPLSGVSTTASQSQKPRLSADFSHMPIAQV